MHITVASVQVNATWGISRLSTARTSLAGRDPLTFTFNYTFDDSAGAGTEAYILDTGCRTSHQDFTNRAKFAASFGSGVPNEDKNGREYPWPPICIPPQCPMRTSQRNQRPWRSR